MLETKNKQRNEKYFLLSCGSQQGYSTQDVHSRSGEESRKPSTEEETPEWHIEICQVIRWATVIGHPGN